MLYLLIRQVKSNYYRHKIVPVDGDPRKFWFTVSEIADQPADKERFPVEVICCNGEPATPDKTYENSQPFKFQ